MTHDELLNDLLNVIGWFVIRSGGSVRIPLKDIPEPQGQWGLMVHKDDDEFILMWMEDNDAEN